MVDSVNSTTEPVTVTFELEVPVTVDPIHLEGEPSKVDFLKEALKIVESAPAFDWVDSEYFHNLTLSSLSPGPNNGWITSVDGDTLRYITVFSGTVHEWIFTKQSENTVVPERFIQGGETYAPSTWSDLPESIITDLQDKGYTIADN